MLLGRETLSRSEHNDASQRAAVVHNTWIVAGTSMATESPRAEKPALLTLLTLLASHGADRWSTVLSA